MVEKGLISRAIGDSLALCPPLIINESQLDVLFDTFEASLDVLKKQLDA